MTLWFLVLIHYATFDALAICRIAVMRMSSADLAKMVELYRAAVPLKEMGEILGIHPSAICRKLKKIGEPGRRVVDTQRVVALRMSGKTRGEITDDTGINWAKYWASARLLYGCSPYVWKNQRRNRD